MSKVHILTFHRALNYGAVLQCYALYKAFNKYIDCDVLDYRARCIENRYSLFRFDMSMKAVCKSILLSRINISKRKKFDSFLKRNIQFTESFYDSSQLREHHWNYDDIFCVGSDQVWNQALIHDDSSFYLDFVQNNAKKTSYAASIGVEVNTHNVEYYKKRLKDFDAISIREKSSYCKLKKMGMRLSRNIDPVFLLSKEEWKEISVPIKNEEVEYVLIYMLQKSDIFMKRAVDYAKKRNKRIVIIAIGMKRSFDAEYIANCGPDEFVRYFLMADTIFTNSFHGIAFSILFNKNFYYELQGNNVNTNSRLNDIIGLFDLKERESKFIGDGKDIDFMKVNESIQRERSNAQKYIKERILRKA